MTVAGSSSAQPRECASRVTRVLVVDDSVVARAVLTRLIADDPRYRVVAAVGDVPNALRCLARETVDVILLDLEMPGTDGLTALPDLLAAGGEARVLVVSSACGDGANATIQALALGAADTLEKPEPGALGARFGDLLFDKLERLGDRSPASPARPSAQAGLRLAPFDVVAIGASTGGIHALGQLLRAIPADFRQPILVTQHLPASFISYFAAQVAVLAGRPCDVAEDHLRVRAGRVTVAPGDAHLTVASLGHAGLGIRLSTVPVTSGCLPSVDPMFASLAKTLGPRLLAVVLSGMGRDGSEGARIVRASGGSLVVQDQASSAVWGMPGSVAAAGLAQAILPPDEIGRLIAAGSAR